MTFFARQLERENAELRKEVAAANKGAKTNAIVNQSLAGKLNQSRQDNQQLRVALAACDTAIRAALNYILILPNMGSVEEFEVLEAAHNTLSKIQPLLKA